MTYEDILKYGLLTRVKHSDVFPTRTFLSKTLFSKPGIATDQKAMEFRYDKFQASLLSDNRLGSKGDSVNPDMEWKSAIIPFGYFAKNAPVTPEEGLALLMDEDPSKPMSTEQRQIAYAARKRDYLQACANLYIEKQCSDVLLTHSLTTKNTGKIEFPMLSSDLIKTKSWASSTYKNQLTDIGDLMSAVRKKSTITPNTILMHPEDVAHITELAQFKSDLDIRRVEAGFVRYEGENAEGIAVAGYVYLNTIGLVRILTYSSNYIDNTGASPVEASFLPKGSLLVYNDQTKIGSINYGRVENVDANGMPIYQRASSLFTVGREANGAYGKFEIQMQTSPCPLPENINSWGVIDGLNG